MNKPYEPERLRRLRDALLTGLLERDLPVRLALIAALAGEHLLMVGPPGKKPGCAPAAPGIRQIKLL